MTKLKTKDLLKFSPSAAERWFNCPIAPIVAALPSKWETSIYAATGTGVMKHLEDALNDIDFYPDEFDEMLGLTEKVDGHDVKYSEGDVEAAKECYEVVAKAEDNGFILKIEEPLECFYDLGSGKKIVQRGRADFVLTSDEMLWVVDYKNGAGVTVEAVNNIQLLSYLTMAIKKFGPRERYRLQIVQPQARYEVPKVWEFGNVAYKGFLESIIAAMHRAYEAADEVAKTGEINIARYEPGDHCKWCPIEHSCPGRVNKIVSAACATSLPVDEGGAFKWVLDNASEIKKSVAAAENRADEMLLAGKEVFGYKLIESTGNRSVKKKLSKQEEMTLRGFGLVKDVPKYPTLAALEKEAKKNKDFDPAPFILDGEKKPKRVIWDDTGRPWGAGDEFEEAEVAKTEE